MESDITCQRRFQMRYAFQSVLIRNSDDVENPQLKKMVTQGGMIHRTLQTGDCGGVTFSFRRARSSRKC